MNPVTVNPVLEAFCQTHLSCDIEGFADFVAPYGVLIGGIYKHFKGEFYKVVGIVRDAEDWENPRVRYVQVDCVEHEAVRLISDFLAILDRDDYKGPRFKLIIKEV